MVKVGFVSVYFIGKFGILEVGVAYECQGSIQLKYPETRLDLAERRGYDGVIEAGNLSASIFLTNSG